MKVSNHAVSVLISFFALWTEDVRGETSQKKTFKTLASRYLRSMQGSHFLCGSRAWCITNKQICVNTTEDDHHCECIDGFAGDNCEPLDECQQDPYPCANGNASTSYCVDYFPPEKYKCGCQVGYTAILPDASEIEEPVPVDWRPKACVMEVVETSPPTPVPTPAPTPAPTDPPYVCDIDTDCSGDNKECVDGLCLCQDGYFSLNGLLGACYDENECQEGYSANECHRWATCSNHDGGYSCKCDDGYVDVDSTETPGTNCKNVNECTEELDDCSDDQLCLDRFPPQKWECIDPTPAPTPAPTRQPRTSSSCSTSPPTEMVDVLAAHNLYRSSVSPAADPPLPEMCWDEELAQVAQAYAEGCVFEHNAARVSQQTTYSTVGENLAANTGSLNLAGNVESWNDESEDYDYAANTCSSVCGHYTQVVWRSSVNIGCGYSLCANLVNFQANAHFLVCNYGPAGNVISQLPY